jgi:hypothetical protein
MCRAIEQNQSVYGHQGKQPTGAPVKAATQATAPVKIADTPNERLVTVLRARSTASPRARELACSRRALRVHRSGVLTFHPHM